MHALHGDFPNGFDHGPKLKLLQKEANFSGFFFIPGSGSIAIKKKKRRKSHDFGEIFGRSEYLEFRDFQKTSITEQKLSTHSTALILW